MNDRRNLSLVTRESSARCPTRRAAMNRNPPRRIVLRTRVFLSMAGILVVAAAAAAPAPIVWEQWRGPRRDGTIPGFRAPSRWPQQLSKRWSVEVGLGHSSPLAADDGAYTFTREG